MKNYIEILNEEVIDPDTIFIQVSQYTRLAHLFQFQGDSIWNLWKYNSKVAETEGYEELSQSWDSLQKLYHDLVGGKALHQYDNKQK